MDTLLASGLAVESYGDCRNNRDEAWRRQGIRVQHIDDQPESHSAKVALETCTSHRIMMAAESRHCPGWIAWNLEHALKSCRAIPLLHQVAGVPDYRGLFGVFPHINASRPGWMRIVQQVAAASQVDQECTPTALSSERWPL